MTSRRGAARTDLGHVVRTKLQVNILVFIQILNFKKLFLGKILLKRKKGWGVIQSAD